MDVDIGVIGSVFVFDVDGFVGVFVVEIWLGVVDEDDFEVICEVVDVEM